MLYHILHVINHSFLSLFILKILVIKYSLRSISLASVICYTFVQWLSKALTHCTRMKHLKLTMLELISATKLTIYDDILPLNN